MTAGGLHDAASFDVAVVGAGIIGASCAYHLADAGLRVAVFERNEAAAMGSTGLSAAGVRVQFVEPVNVALSLASILEYRSFQDRFGTDAGYRPVGYLMLVPTDAWEEHLRGVEVQRAAGAPVEVLGLADARERFVDFDVTGLAGATFGPFDGVVDPDAITQAYLRRARERGAQVSFRSPVAEVARDGDAWRLSVGNPSSDSTLQDSTLQDSTLQDSTSVRATTIVNAAGCWSGELGRLAGIDIPVQPVRRMIYLTAPITGRRPSPLVVDIASGLYFRTESERLLFGRSNPAEPAGFTTGMDWDWLEPTLEVATGRFPWIADESLDPAASWYGYYEMTPDHNAVLGTSEQAPGWVDACGFSGHGVQHAPAVGRAVREEIVDGRSHTFDIDPLRASRFAAGRRRFERHII